MGVFSGIFIDIGGEQSIENDLSTYSSHLSNMKYFLMHANSSTMILADEMGSTPSLRLAAHWRSLSLLIWVNRAAWEL